MGNVTPLSRTISEAAVRDLLAAIKRALTLPGPASAADERRYHQLLRERADEVLGVAGAILGDPAEFDNVDLLLSAAVLRDRLADRQPDYPTAP